ncbi:MAG TPA: hypothetical protein VFK06_05295 [Candidatus Angelobacter sp.]|nr:hypothetical protein [Candidatus Angelobacter sp.]
MLRILLLIIGFAVFVGAFFLPALVGGAAPGYFYAWITLVLPWGHDGMNMLREQPMQYAAVLLAGLINPLFLVTLLLIALKKLPRTTLVLSILVVLMLPSCWVIFHHENFHPGKGHFLWITGMLLVLIAGRLGAARTRPSGAAA